MVAEFFPEDPRPLLIRGARVVDPAAGLDGVHDLWVSPAGVVVDPGGISAAHRVVEAQGLWALPGLVDLQVHFRQPGFDHKETLRSGSRAALAGGVTSVVVMPNTQPALDSAEAVRFQVEEAARVDGVRVLVAGAATVGLRGEVLTDHAALQAAGAVAITDDGLPVLDDGLMAASLAACAAADLLFMQHAERTDLTRHAPMTEGPTSRALGVAGQPADAEGLMVERDVALAARAGARYHVLHTSTARSLAAVRGAKAQGLAVSCEASPHHLLLTDAACAGADPHFKMNPPLRAEADRQALLAALADGTVDAIATDHAPHTAAEKAQGFAAAPFGVVGLETAFAAALWLVAEGVISVAQAVALMSAGPARVLRQVGRLGTMVGAGAPADVCVVDPHQAWAVGPEDFFGQCANSPFLGWTFPGRVVGTVLRGRLRYARGL